MDDAVETPMRAGARPAVLALAMLAAAVVEAAAQAGAPPAQAPGASQPDLRWLPRYDFALEVDGKPSPDACFFQERDGRRLLVHAPEVGKVCILDQEGKQVTAVERSKVKIEGDGDAARLLPGAEASAPATSYTLDAASVVFYLGSSRLKIAPKKPLVGPAGAEEILRHSPLYKKGIEAYVPQPEEVAYLRSLRPPVEIEVFFGTWCPHCKVLVPKFMKTVGVVANPSLHVSYHGVPRDFGNYDPARAKRVVGIPTFIFWSGGKEVGRIPGEPTDGTIEHAVAEILRAASK